MFGERERKIREISGESMTTIQHNPVVPHKSDSATPFGIPRRTLATMALVMASFNSDPKATAQERVEGVNGGSDTVLSNHKTDQAAMLTKLNEVARQYSERQLAATWDLSTVEYNKLWQDIAIAAGVPDNVRNACRNTQEMALALEDKDIYVFIDRNKRQPTFGSDIRYQIEGLFILFGPNPATDFNGQQVLVPTSDTQKVGFVPFKETPSMGFRDLASAHKRVYRPDLAENEIGHRRTADIGSPAAPSRVPHDTITEIVAVANTRGYFRYADQSGTTTLTMEDGTTFHVNGTQVNRVISGDVLLREDFIVALYKPSERKVVLGCMEPNGTVYVRVPKGEGFIPRR